MSLQRFDYIIVGSGMGGSAAAYALTQKGQSVLLIEAGGEIIHDEKDWDGLEILVRGRYKSDRPIQIKQYNQKKFFQQPQEEVLGGKTMFYGGACFRLRETDFQKWELGYEDFEPWYDEAEKMLEVHGHKEGDPTMPPKKQEYPYPPSELSEPSQRIKVACEKLGLRPFRIPMAINTFNHSRPVCISCNTCDGFPCRIKAKNDAVSCFLDKADPKLLHIELNTIVDQMIMDGNKAVGVRGFSKAAKSPVEYHANRIFICAGAIESPAIIMRSKVQDVSGRLGKNLMRHCNAVVGCLFPFQTNPQDVFHKQLAITDLYEQDRMNSGMATGVIQDIYMPPKEVLPHFVPFGIKTLTKFLRGHIQNLLCVTEDEPLMTNRVELSDKKNHYGFQKIRVHHQYPDSDIKRNQILIQTAKKILSKAGGLGFMVRKIDTFSHAVGTTVFGSNPSTSVLDLECKLHGTENVYVVDGGFMPTSAGVNPSLTIAANALRVCSSIEGRDK